MFRLALFLIISSVAFSAGARDVLELESQRRGDGTFEYRLRTLHDPIFSKIEFHQLAPMSFPNFVEGTPPPHWTNFFYPEWGGIMFSYTTNQPRTNEIAFTARSSSTHFRRQSYGFIAIIYLEFISNYNDLSGIGGYVTLDCLVPCSAEQADGSLPKLTTRLELIKDIKIDSLIYTNRQVHGVSYSWNQPSTVDFEGSHNLKDWNLISRFFGDPPQTTWTTNQPLNSYGRFFRLSLVANSHIPNAVLHSTISQTSRAVALQNIRFVGDQFTADFASIPGTLYEASYLTTSNQILGSCSLTATNDISTVSFPRDPAVHSGYIKIERSN